MKNQISFFALLLVSIAASAARLPTNVIPTHNAIGFSYHDASVTSAGKTITANVGENAANEMITLTLAEPIAAGTASIHIGFDAPINKRLRGFYLSRTPARKYAVTQFESTDARRAFPSFDEPAMRATFDLSAVIDTSDIAIGNGRMISDRPGPGDGKHTVTFAQTKPLPTYLLALLIGDVQCSEGSARDVRSRGYTCA